MIIASISENQQIEKRIAITPDIAKKYTALGLEVYLPKKYAQHLGIQDEEYEKLGVKIFNEEKEVINSADIIIQLGLISEDKQSALKDNQTFIGILNPYINKEKIDKLIKKRDLNSKLVRRRGRVYIINKTNPKFKARQK